MKCKTSNIKTQNNTETFMRYEMASNVHSGPFHEVIQKVKIAVFGNVTMRDRFLKVRLQAT